MPTGTVTFLFADMEEDGLPRPEEGVEEKNVRLAWYEAIFRQAMEANRGYIYKKVGNSFQVAFATASQAAAGAAAAQRALQGMRNESTPGTQDSDALIPHPAFRIRMALHTGVTDIREGGYVGPLLNRVARLLAAGHGGQVLLTQAVEELLRDDAPPGIILRDLGEHRLKDLIRPEHIYQLDYTDPSFAGSEPNPSYLGASALSGQTSFASSGLPPVFPALRTLDSRPNNLPLQPTPLIGREADVEAVREELLRGDLSLLTLLGAGGIGKTRLALQVAAEMLEDFADGVFFVSLASISDARLVQASIGQALGVKETGGQSQEDALRGYLHDKRMLLLLDNCEQVLQAGPALAELLAESPGLKMLATSRAPFRLSVEHEYMVPALPLPNKGAALSAEALLGYKAVELFVTRARSVKSDFSLSESNKDAVTEICRRVDGLPLAIELAAARVRALAPEAIAARLAPTAGYPGGAGKLLTGGGRDMPARQQTLRNTIQWSYDLLSPDEQRLFNRLGVFVGGHSLEAAEAVCAAQLRVDGCELRVDDAHEVSTTNSQPSTRNSSYDVLEGLGSLMDKSLIYSRDEAGETRFLMLETLHEFALERLSEGGEEGAIRQAHAGYYLQLSEQAESHFMGPSQAQWLERLEAEHDNIRATIELLYKQGSMEELGRLASSLWRFWLRHGHLTEGRRTLKLGLEQEEKLSEAVRARVLHGAGVMAYEQGDYDEAKSLYERSLAIRRKLGDKMGVIASLNNLANVAFFGSDYASASGLYEEASVLARELQDNWAIAITLGNRGWVEMNRGDYDRAAGLYEESLALRRLIGDEWGIANALDNLAWARTYQGRFAEAASVAADSMAIVEKMGDRDTISDLLDIQGRCALGQGDLAAARTLFLKGLSLNREVGDKTGTALCLMGLAALAEAQGQWERAARLFGAADALRASTAHFQRVYFERQEASVRAHLGEPRFDELLREGREMPPEELIEYATGDRWQ